MVAILLYSGEQRRLTLTVCPCPPCAHCQSLYACNISPAFTVDSTNLPADLTACPYTVTGKRDKPDADDSPHSKRAKVSISALFHAEPNLSPLTRSPVSTVLFCQQTPGFVRAGAMEAAMVDPPRHEEQLMSTRWDFTPPTRRPPPPHYVCNICHLPNHWIQDCPNKPPPSADSDVPPASYVCKKCHQPGHYVRLCPLVLEEEAAREAGRPPPSYICNKCHQPGHFIRSCPLIADEMKARHDGPPPGDYRCRKCGGLHWITACPVIAEEEKARGKRKEGVDGAAGAGCWFCLATEGVRVHLIVSVGDECYVALAKGPLVPHHLLILPITHVQAATQMTEAQEQEASKSLSEHTHSVLSLPLRCRRLAADV